jgi:hypothetical protein
MYDTANAFCNTCTNGMLFDFITGNIVIRTWIRFPRAARGYVKMGLLLGNLLQI